MPARAGLGVAVHVVRVWIALMAVGACVTGLALLLGGAERSASPSLRVATWLLPWWGWTALFITTGLLLLGAGVTHQRCVLWAAVPPALAYAVFAGSIAFSASNPIVPFTGVFTYAGLAVLTTVSGYLGRWVFTISRAIA